MKQKIYYFDGYHGGQEGHMPIGAFRTILDFLDEKPEWKVNLDIEPESWKLLKHRDPDTYYRLHAKIKEGRIEIVNEFYSQPITCTLNGESVIRNLVYGREAFKRYMGDVKVENYFSQEPTFTSCLPQILLSLGYKHVSLFNSTIFAGYSKGVNAPVVRWLGNDGSEILAIPSYPVNEIVKQENNGSTWWSWHSFFAPPDYVQICNQAGITLPSAMGLQDLGWTAELAPEAKRDGIDRSYLEYVTAKDYFDIVDPTNAPIVSGQELMRVGLAWSEKTLSAYLKATRKYEYALLNAELLNVLSVVNGNDSLDKDIRACWKSFMLASHHDVWVCTNHEFTESMRYQLYALDNQYRDLESDLKTALIDDSGEELIVTVFNPSSKAGRRYVELDASLHNEIKGCLVLENGQDLQAELFEKQVNVDVFEPLDAGASMYNGCHKKIAFYCDLKGFESKEFKLKPVVEQRNVENSLIIKTENVVVFENEFVKITIDLTHGGCISSYYDKVKNFEFVKEGGFFNELKGFFDADKRFVSNIEQPAKVLAIQSGENVSAIKLAVPISSVNVTIEYTFYKGNSYIDVKTGFSCASGTKIGDPYKTSDWHDLHRTIYDIKYGLNAYFATSFKQKHLDKHCAFDICRTQEESTSYNNVKDIKHNIAVNWLDVTDENHGVAVFVNRTTSYVKEKQDEVGVSLLWGTDCSCIWSSNLSNVSSTETYRIYPHEGTWEDVDIWTENDMYNRKLCPFIGKMKQPLKMPFEVKTDKVEVSAVFVENGQCYIRLFNYGQSGKVIVEVGNCFDGIIPCTHDKKVLGALLNKNELNLVEFSMRRFEIQTFQLSKTNTEITNKNERRNINGTKN